MISQSKTFYKLIRIRWQFHVKWWITQLIKVKSILHTPPQTWFLLMHLIHFVWNHSNIMYPRSQKLFMKNQSNYFFAVHHKSSISNSTLGMKIDYCQACKCFGELNIPHDSFFKYLNPDAPFGVYHHWLVYSFQREHQYTPVFFFLYQHINGFYQSLPKPWS